MVLKLKISANQRFHKYERMLRRIRLRIFDYEDQGKLDKAQRIIAFADRDGKPESNDLNTTARSASSGETHE